MSNQRVTGQQTGGAFVAITTLQKIADQFDSPFRILYGVIATLVIVYSSLLPSSVSSFIDSIVGRMLCMGGIYLATTKMSWTYGLLTALAFLVVLRSTSTSYAEGFYGGSAVTEKARIGKRWFVEKVLGEDPQVIATEKVVTHPVQD
jgi:hypothetical protein